MRILNYNLNSNYRYRVQLKPDAKWSKVKSPVGMLYKSVPTEISKMEHFNDLLNFIPYIRIYKHMNTGEDWIVVLPEEDSQVEEKTTINKEDTTKKTSKKRGKKKVKKDDLSDIQLGDIKPLDSEEVDDIPETNLSDLDKIEPIKGDNDDNQ